MHPPPSPLCPPPRARVELERRHIALKSFYEKGGKAGGNGGGRKRARADDTDAAAAASNASPTVTEGATPHDGGNAASEAAAPVPQGK